MNDIKHQLKAALPALAAHWDEHIVPTLCDYIRIPNKSPAFDPDWQQHGHMDRAMQLIVDWCREHSLDNMHLDLLQRDGRTPLLVIDIPGQSDDTVLLYGHMDKQPEMCGWDSDKSPWQPVIKDGKLYGRGGADDGYAIFSAMAAIAMLQHSAISHSRCVILIEASEESGSVDLPYYLEVLGSKIGVPSLIICLDSGAGNYDQLWCTTSLRGVVAGELVIRALDQGMHSGMASGVVPSIFSILHTLISRIEDPIASKIILNALSVDIPQDRLLQAKAAAAILDKTFIDGYPLAGETMAVDSDITQLLLNQTWRPALSITGIDGVPKTKNAGNVTLPYLSLKLSLRVPPTLDVDEAQTVLKKAFEATPPFNADITYTPLEAGPGWNAPVLADWLLQANEAASQLFYNKSAAYWGEGGSIPFMGMLGDRFPEAQFVITGVLGPLSNAHGPNEFLHINFAKKLTACVAYILAAHYQQTLR